MRREVLVGVVLISISLAGCHKKRTLSNFNLKPGLTAEDVEEEMGTPAKVGGHWIAYTLDDGNELRMEFIAGERGATRTLSSAEIYSGSGPTLTITSIFKLPPAAQPASTTPSTTPATLPTTNP